MWGQRDCRTEQRGASVALQGDATCRNLPAVGLETGRLSPARLPAPTRAWPYLFARACMQVHEDRGRNKTTSVLHHDLMLSLLQQQLYELADHGVTGKQPFAPVVGPQAAWCFRVLPWWRQEKGRTVVAMEEVQNDGQEAGGDGGRAGRT